MEALDKLARAYAFSWKVSICYNTKSWKSHAEATKEIQELFVPVPTGPTLVLNVISYVALVLVLNWLAGFSEGVQTLYCFVFVAANVCHGPMLLLLYFPPEHVAIHVVNSTWMVQQLCYGHGNLDGFFHAADFPLLLFAPFGRCSSCWMAGIHHLSFEYHWELCTEAWRILAMAISVNTSPICIFGIIMVNIPHLAIVSQ